jgi:hypothetical protein
VKRFELRVAALIDHVLRRFVLHPNLNKRLFAWMLFTEMNAKSALTFV